MYLLALIPIGLPLLALGLGVAAASSFRTWRAQENRSFSDEKFEQFAVRGIACLIGVFISYLAFERMSHWGPQ